MVEIVRCPEKAVTFMEKKLGLGESLSVSDSRIHTMVKEIEEYNSNYDCDAF